MCLAAVAACLDRVSLVAAEYQLSRTPVGITRRLNESHPCGAKSCIEAVHVINTEVQVQMAALLNKRNNGSGVSTTCGVNAAATRVFAAAEIGVPQFAYPSHLLAEEGALRSRSVVR